MRYHRPALAVVATAGLTLACSHVPFAAAFHPDRLSQADVVIGAAIAEGRTVGGVLRIERDGATYEKAFGARAVEPAREAAAVNTIYDVASLTKAVATAPSILLLQQRGSVSVDERVSRYIPEFVADGRDEITLRHLLTHTSALPAGLDLRDRWSGADEAVRRAAAQTPSNRPGIIFRYSDTNYILLGEIVRRVSGRPLDVFAREEIFLPLGMRDTMFNPPAALHGRVAPTERVDGTPLRGSVHDPTARRMGGVAGHAGLFTTSSDLARFLRALARQESPLFSRETLRLMSSVQSPPDVALRRSLGFDIDTMFSKPRGHFPLGSFGHTGWTGSFFWVDPSSRTFYSFLSNRNHPRGGSVVELQKRLGRAVSNAIDFDFSRAPRLQARHAAEREIPVSGTRVDNGIDVLATQRYSALSGLRVALVTNHTGRDRAGNPTIDLLRSARGVELRALFAPEHGIRGDSDELVANTTDAKSGLPIYSLYDKTIAPTAEELRGIDAIVFDVQDIGVRYYTYPYVLFNVMRSAAEAKLKMIVLDRVNPLDGITLGGPTRVEKTIPSAFHPIAIRHGMTVGELARMFNDERELGVDLTVVPVRGWKRELWFDETDLAWIDTSPNLRNMTAAALYPATGMIETAKVSVGRGTDMPLEIVGAPYVDAALLARELHAAEVGGVRFHPLTFTPAFREFKGELCGGVRIEVVDRERLDPLRLGVTLMSTLHRLYGEKFQLDKANVLLQHQPTIDAIRAGRSVDEVMTLWSPELEAFRARRAKYLLY